MVYSLTKKKLETDNPGWDGSSWKSSEALSGSFSASVPPSLEGSFYPQGHNMTPGASAIIPMIWESWGGGATAALPGALACHITWPLPSVREPGKGNFATGHNAQSPCYQGRRWEYMFGRQLAVLVTWSLIHARYIVYRCMFIYALLPVYEWLSMDGRISGYFYLLLSTFIY